MATFDEGEFVLNEGISRAASIPLDIQASGKEVAKNSAMISAFNVFGFVSALLIDVTVAAHFGLGQETDAFFIAFAVPQLITSILLVAANVAFVPVFTNLAIEKGESSLWHTISSLTNLSLLGGSFLAIMGSLSAPIFIRALGAGLDDEVQRLAVSLCTLVFLMVIPLGAIEVFKAALNSLGSFAVPAATALIRNGTTFLAILLFSQRLEIYSLVWGYVTGTWFQFAFVGLILLVKGFRYQLILRWREPWTAKALSQIRPPLAGAMLGQSNILLERFLASFLPVGVVSALVYARRILRAVDSIFVGSISTALLPRLSTQFSQSNTLDYKRLLLLGVKLATFISAPVTVGIISLNVPIVQLLFQRGVFIQETTHTIAKFLSIYILSIPPMALFQILIASYYAAGDTKTPFYVRIVMLGFDVVLYLVLFFVLGAPGLALTLFLSRVIVLVLVLRLLNRRVGSFGSDLLSFTIRISLASIVMGMLVVWLFRTALGGLGHIDSFGLVFRLVISAAVGAGAYVLLLLIFRVREVEQAFRLVQQRFKPVQARRLES